MIATYNAPGAPAATYTNPTDRERLALILRAPDGAVIGVNTEIGSATFNVMPGAYRIARHVETRSHVKTFAALDTAISVFLEQVELLS